MTLNHSVITSPLALSHSEVGSAKIQTQGCDGRSMVAHQTTVQEVQSSIPTRSWAFFLFFSSLSYLSHIPIPRGGATLLIFNLPTKNEGLAM